jgi:hypothetical protein
MKRQIDAARDSIGRDIIFYTASLTACPTCVTGSFYDPVNDVSYFVTCPQCSGAYWLQTAVPHTILARVHWVNDEAITATPGGRYFVGEATATIDESNLSIAQQCETESGKVVVDDHDMQIIRIIPVGAFDITRYRVVLRNMGDRPS